MSKRWLKLGALNTLEHGVTRFADAGVSIILLWSLQTEEFARLAIAQAVVAPLLICFVQPETVIYRDYSVWKELGPSALAARIHAFRVFAWGKAQLALFIAALIPLAHAGSGSWADRFAAMLWAFSIALAPQLAGPDREFLRMELKLRELNFLSFYQKLSILAGVVGVAVLKPVDGIRWLAAIAAFSALSAAWLARAWARKAMSELGASPGSLIGHEGPKVAAILSDSLRTFSIWNHLAGVVQNSVQTLDLFLLGVMRFPFREVGLYAALLKVANLTVALPMAMTSLFTIWLGRAPLAGRSRADERSKLFWLSGALLALALLQAAVMAWFAPWIFEFLSHGRWDAPELERMQRWFTWILFGAALLGGSLLLSSWQTLRETARGFFVRVSLPWFGAALGIYSYAAWSGGMDSLARANVAVGGLYLLLNIFLVVRKRP